MPAPFSTRKCSLVPHADWTFENFEGYSCTPPGCIVMCADAVTALMSGASIRTRSLHRHCLRAMLRSVRGRRCRKVSTVVCRVCHSLGLLRAGYTHTGVQRLTGRTRSIRCNGGSDGWAERAADRSAVVAGSTRSRSLCSQPKDRKGALQRAALAPIMQAHAHASKRAHGRAHPHTCNRR
jgi:hypothetical protein